MPFTSTQISGLVGGQQVMFANQATFANQIGGMGGGQQQPMMANPYPSPSYGVAGLDPASPDIGTKLAGSAALGVPGIAAGVGMGASMLGYNSAAGLLDPFTGVSRAFGAGTGGSAAGRMATMMGTESAALGSRGGMGLATGWANISGAFARGGIRAGMGAVGGGLAAAGAMALPYYVAGKALEYGTENLYEGTQNFQDTRRMASQYMDPQYGQPGTRLGGRMGAGQVKQMTSFMHELAGEDVQTTMKDMRALMDRSGQMGMLQGVGDINQFKQRFKEIVRQTRGIAQMLGTTLEEALPVTQKLQQMGMWTARDILGTAGAIKAAGPGGAGAMMGAMEQGAQMSHAMGGRLESGARLGQELFTQVGAATRAGIFSQQDIRNITGGVGGAEGQRMMAGSMQQVFAGFGQSAMGRLMMAGLGETKQGAFTGQMDEKLLAQFKRGEIGVEELQARGQKRINTSKEMAVSFFNKADVLGQEMAQKGGMTGVAQGIQQAMVKAGYGGATDNIQNRFIQLITHSNQQQADMIQKIIKDLPRIQADEDRRTQAALEDSFKQLDERRNRSWEGLKDVVANAVHQGVGRPLQELGESFTTSMTEATERASDWFTGRTKSMPRLSMEQKFMLAQAGALQPGGSKSWGDLGVKNIGQEFVQPTGLTATAIGNIREQGFGGIAANMLVGAGIGGVAGSFVPGIGTGIGAAAGALAGGITAALNPDDMEGPRVRALRRAGMETYAGTEAGAGEVVVGEGRLARVEDAHRVARRAYLRSADATMGGLLGGETDEKRKAMETVKARMREIYTNPQTAVALRELREKDPEAHARKIKELMGSDPKTQSALTELEEATPGGAGKVDAMHDVLAVAQKELGYEGKMAIDYGKMASDIGTVPGTPKEIEQFRQDAVQEMSEAAGGFSWGGLASNALLGAGLGAAVGGPLAALTAAAGAIIGGGAYMATRGGMNESDIQEAMSSNEFTVADIQEYASGKSGKDNRFARSLAGGKNAAAQKIDEFLSSASEEDKSRFLGGMSKVWDVDRTRFSQERSKKAQELAQKSGPIGNIKGISAGVTSQLEKARKVMAEGDVTSGEGILSQIAGGQQLGEEELNLLRSGRAGALGVQAGRLATIQGMGEMDATQYKAFMSKLSSAGVNFENAPGLQEKVNEMLSSGGKISGGEVKELKDMLTKMAPATLGQGVGGTTLTPAQEAQEKYITAMSNFTTAVNKLAVVDAKDVKTPNGTVLAPTGN